jgi:hypothetical protein
MTARLALLAIPQAHLRALEFLLERVSPLQHAWCLTGSAGLRLQGVDVPVHDLDIQADQNTIYLMEQQLAGFMKIPVHLLETADMRSLDGKADFPGVEIELLANTTHRRPDNSWSACTDFSRLIWVETHGLQIPVFPLEDEFEAYTAMGRTEKAALIKKTIQKALQ